jgi:hypothetical protein
MINAVIFYLKKRKRLDKQGGQLVSDNTKEKIVNSQIMESLKSKILHLQ